MELLIRVILIMRLRIMMLLIMGLLMMELFLYESHIKKETKITSGKSTPIYGGKTNFDDIAVIGGECKFSSEIFKFFYFAFSRHFPNFIVKNMLFGVHYTDIDLNIYANVWYICVCFRP